ncbi:MAG TPA: thiamine phosphate synthase [Solirubrobacteraceae bacterium]|nr:thiamine phosphate synthase [Solirubrobacteraceae bacterium]
MPFHGLHAARLYLVTSARPGGRPLREVLEPALRGGVDLFQLREKEPADDDALLTAAQEARSLCAAAGVPFILNDRPDLVEAAGADGVHVGQEDLPVEQARALVGAQRIVGLSTHAPQQLAAARGADYVVVGPVHATPTKPGRPAAGLAYVRHATAHPPAVPCFAIGGIDAATIGAVVAAGARRVVVVRAIAEATDPEAAARALRAALDEEPLRGAA